LPNAVTLGGASPVGLRGHVICRTGRYACSSGGGVGYSYWRAKTQVAV